MAQQLDSKVREVLSAATVDGNLLRMAPIGDRKLYEQVNKVLDALGGKWNRREQAHVFATDPADKLAQVLNTGQAAAHPRTADGFVATPAELACTVVRYPYANVGNLPAGAWVLEPSAGTGPLVQAVLDTVADPTLRVVAVEPDAQRAFQIRQSDRVSVHMSTFEEYAAAHEAKKGRLFDVVVMNPPYSVEGNRTIWIDHLWLAWSMVAPGGRLTAIVPAGYLFRQDKRHARVRELVDAHGRHDELPVDAFKESGSGVRTFVLQLDKPLLLAVDVADGTPQEPAAKPKGLSVTVTVDRDELADALAFVVKAVPERPAVAVLDSVLLAADDTGGVQVSCYDFEQARTVSVPGEVQGAGRIVMAGAKVLADWVAALPVGAGAVSVELGGDGRAQVACKRSKLSLLTYPVEDFPGLPQVPSTTNGVLDAKVFDLACRQVAVSAATDHYLPDLTGVMLQISGGMLSMSATDARRAAVRDVSLSRAGVGAGRSGSALTPAGPLVQVAKVFAGLGGPVTIGVDDGDSVAASCGRYMYVCRTMDAADYPNVRTLIPNRYARLVDVDLVALRKAVTRVSTGGRRKHQVRLMFNMAGVDVVALVDGAEVGRETLKCAWVEAADVFSIVFNVGYLLDGLAALAAGKVAGVRFGFGSASEPASMIPLGEGRKMLPGMWYLIMPVPPVTPGKAVQAVAAQPAADVTGVDVDGVRVAVTRRIDLVDEVVLRTLADFRRAAVAGSRWQCVNYLHPHVSGLRTIKGGKSVLKYVGVKADGTVIPNGSMDLPKKGEVRFEGRSVHFLAKPGGEEVAFTWTWLHPEEHAAPTPAVTPAAPAEQPEPVEDTTTQPVGPVEVAQVVQLRRPRRTLAELVGVAPEPVQPAVTAGFTRLSIGTQIEQAHTILGIPLQVDSDSGGGAPGYVIDGRRYSPKEAADLLLAGGFERAFGRAHTIVNPHWRDSVAQPAPRRITLAQLVGV